MPKRAHDILEGMGELLLSLARTHCSSRQWSSWLKALLEAAASKGDADMVLVLLRAGAPPSSGRPGDCVTPLHAAARGGSLAVLESLLKTRAIRDINKKTLIAGDTPLHLAVKRGHADVALALMRAGGDVNLVDTRRRSPLMRAAFGGRAELVKDLLLSGSRVDDRNNDGDTALALAVQQGHLGVIKVLLQAKACVDTRGRELIAPDLLCLSPVDMAVRRGDTAALLMLTSAPNLSALGDDGNSAMCIAVRYGHVEAIEVLVDAGKDVNSAIDDKEFSPLHVACFYLQPGSVQALLHRNADEKLRTPKNHLPGDVLGQSIHRSERDSDIVGGISEMLARAPADRIWRRRGWLAMLNARKRGAVKEEQQQHRRGGYADEAEDNQEDEAESLSVLSSRRKLDEGGEWSTDDAVHPSLKRFHTTVTKMIDVADELIFRNIVSYL